jgi:hypothetical protein
MLLSSSLIHLLCWIPRRVVGDQVHTTHLLEELTCAGEVCTMEETLLIHCENVMSALLELEPDSDEISNVIHDVQTTLAVCGNTCR